MFEQNTPVNEAREIYKINNILRNYRINFYYSLRKDAIFLFEGRSVKSLIYTAYVLTSVGSMVFLMTVFFPALFSDTLRYFLLFPLSVISCLAGTYILWDFYQKIKYNKTKTMITRNGISFRDHKDFELWTAEKIKNLEVVQTARKKDMLKPGYSESDLKRSAKIIVYNHLGKTKTLLEISDSDRQMIIADLDEVAQFIRKFYQSTFTKTDTELHSTLKEKTIV